MNKSSEYEDCKKQAKIIYDFFYSEFKAKGDIPKDFFIEYPDVRKLDIKSSVLVLGLNPSGGDDNVSVKRKAKSPNLFWYVPQINGNSNEGFKELHLRAQKLSYQKYFKTYVEFFQKIKPQYNPLWYNERILQEIFEKSENKNLVDEKLRVFLLDNFCKGDNKHYILFADLIQYTKTDSKEVIKHINEITELVDHYIISLLGYLKPKLVLSANAFVSNYLVRLFKVDENDTCIDACETKIFLASMLTGQRAMDTFSRERLFREIREFIN